MSKKQLARFRKKQEASESDASRLAALGHLAICLPIYGDLPADFVVSLIDLIQYTRDFHPLVEVLIGNQAYVDYNRNELVKRAFKKGATEILFIDQDMKFPHDLYVRLKQHHVPVVSGLYFKRLPPHDPLIFDWAAHDRIDTFPRLNYSGKLEQCGAVGMGATLIQMDAIEAVLSWQIEAGDKFPAPFRVHPPIGEDIYFCKHLQYCDVPVYCDTSLILGHMGMNEVSEEHFLLTARYGSMRGALDRLEQLDGKADFGLGRPHPDGPVHQPSPDSSPLTIGVSQEAGVGGSSGE